MNLTCPWCYQQVTTFQVVKGKHPDYREIMYRCTNCYQTEQQRIFRAFFDYNYNIKTYTLAFATNLNMYEMHVNLSDNLILFFYKKRNDTNSRGMLPFYNLPFDKLTMCNSLPTFHQLISLIPFS